MTRAFLIAAIGTVLAACGGGDNGGGESSEIASLCAKLEADPEARPYVTRSGADFETFCDCMAITVAALPEQDAANATIALKAVTDRIDGDINSTEAITDMLENEADSEDATDEQKAIVAGIDVIDDVIFDVVNGFEDNAGQCAAG